MTAKQKTTSLSLLLAGLLLAGAVPSRAAAPHVAAGKAAAGYHRVTLGPGNNPFPYDIEIPDGWSVRHDPGFEGIWLAPPDAVLGKDSRTLYVRISPAPMPDAATIIANIRKSDAEKPEWSAPELSVRKVGSVEGVLVRMDTGLGPGARSTLTLKVPLAPHSVDFMVSSSRAEFDKLRPFWERMLFSVRKRPGAP